LIFEAFTDGLTCYVQLRRLQYIHSRHFIHRDLKPSNIVMGIGKQANVVHLIDFGLSKQFRDPKTRIHIPYNNGLGLIGTANFASINSHLGLELGRRDDMESLAYILIYFLCGFLPWQGVEAEGHDIVELKQGITTHDCFQALPMEFRAFLEHCRSLSFDAKPNYDHFRAIFDDLLLREGFQNKPIFEWDAVGGPLPGRSSERDVSGGCGIPKRTG
jgi:serine/threonine protein kinase